ncbi:hypothetical protein CDAR_405541 [Caerostris darwini]|uniref:Uncharacterized protein n=1 Tax=Caerostris darwini TaxID=1538125 RepID=A0AAV4WHQ5_9ARAC|nr:hypothetical protein CDAR_405541 [Caerostris darwini]
MRGSERQNRCHGTGFSRAFQQILLFNCDVRGRRFILKQIRTCLRLFMLSVVVNKDPSKRSEQFAGFRIKVIRLATENGNHDAAGMFDVSESFIHGTVDDYLFMNQSNSYGEDETEFDDVLEDIKEDEYDELSMFSNEESYPISFDRLKCSFRDTGEVTSEAESGKLTALSSTSKFPRPRLLDRFSFSKWKTFLQSFIVLLA